MLYRRRNSPQLRQCLSRREPRFLHWRQAVILLEIGLLLTVSLIPAGEMSNMIANLLVSFTCAVQLETFRKFNGNVFASTMCTGNLRSATEKLNLFLMNHSPEERRKSTRYFLVDGVFVVGAVLGAVFTTRFGIRAVWLCCVILLGVFFMMFSRKHIEKN